MDGFQLQEAVVPEREVPLCDQLLEPLLAGAFKLGPLDLGEVRYGHRDELAVMPHNPVLRNDAK